ncbi:MAG: cupin domain-containing protein [Trueperaceae bacterium]|nr:cupin domain-containing protein [Trueperaceae bacterium]MCO5173800.1 cupin domain-containing protein [Trueperaceae bacterium]MCW5818988.1 cupin domain-containing protein [Trueperaceae bacterium]
MKTVTISGARRFSLESVQRRTLVEEAELLVELICFEAGQGDEPSSPAGSVVYQVLEGEALVRSGGATTRLGKGKLLSLVAHTEHALENAGGGLLVVLATSAR